MNVYLLGLNFTSPHPLLASPFEMPAGVSYSFRSALHTFRRLNQSTWQLLRPRSAPAAARSGIKLCVTVFAVFVFHVRALYRETYWPSVWLDFNSRFKHALGSGPYTLKISAGFNFVLLLHVAMKVTGKQGGVVMVFAKCQSRLLLLPPASLCEIFLVVKLSTSCAACLASLCLCVFSCFSCIYMAKYQLLLAQYCGTQQGFKYSTWLLWQT